MYMIITNNIKFFKCFIQFMFTVLQKDSGVMLKRVLKICVIMDKALVSIIDTFSLHTFI